MSNTQKYLIWTAIALIAIVGSFIIYKKIYSIPTASGSASVPAESTKKPQEAPAEGFFNPPSPVPSK